MAKKTFITIKTMLYSNIDLTIELGEHEIKVFPFDKGLVKGIVINPYGGVFGMTMQSNKNNINKVFTEHKNGKSRYTYSIVVEGATVYFELNENLLDIPNWSDAMVIQIFDYTLDEIEIYKANEVKKTCVTIQAKKEWLIKQETNFKNSF